MEVGAVMLLEVAFQSDQIGQLPQSLKQRGGVLSVFDSVRVANGNHLVVHIQKSSYQFCVVSSKRVVMMR